MAFADFVSGLGRMYSSFLNSVPEDYRSLVSLLILVIVIVLYAIFIWKFHQFLARKNIFHLNLKKYNRFEHEFLVKCAAVILYFIEYLIVLPLLVFFWFIIFSTFLILFTEVSQTTANILLISAAIIGAVRMAAYYNEDLSKDLAKLIPFTLLGIAILNPTFFSFERVVERLGEISSFSSSIFYYLIFIMALETILRIFEFGFSLIAGDSEEEE